MAGGEGEQAPAPAGPVLVTGASGFIGSRLVARLAKTGGEIHAVSRSPVAHDAVGPRWWQADLADVAATRALVRAVRPAAIFHLASHVAGARDVALVIPTFANNLGTTVNLLTAAAEAGSIRVVLAGSMEEPQADSAESVPCSPYAAAKFAATGYGRMFHALFGVPVVLLRLFMVYGPGQRDVKKLIPYVILSLLRGESPELMSGERAVDWIFVEDVVDALIAAASASGIDGTPLDVGSGELVSVREVVRRLVDIMQPAVQPRFGALPDRMLEQIRVADVATSESRLGWRPSTSLDDGLRKTVEWYVRRRSKE
jgi:nucleoside-diphosphate-sugar epimerase